MIIVAVELPEEGDKEGLLDREREEEEESLATVAEYVLNLMVLCGQCGVAFQG